MYFFYYVCLHVCVGLHVVHLCRTFANVLPYVTSAKQSSANALKVVTQSNTQISNPSLFVRILMMQHG